LPCSVGRRLPDHRPGQVAAGRRAVADVHAGPRPRAPATGFASMGVLTAVPNPARSLGWFLPFPLLVSDGSFRSPCRSLGWVGSLRPEPPTPNERRLLVSGTGPSSPVGSELPPGGQVNCGRLLLRPLRGSLGGWPSPRAVLLDSSVPSRRGLGLGGLAGPRDASRRRPRALSGLRAPGGVQAATVILEVELVRLLDAGVAADTGFFSLAQKPGEDDRWLLAQRGSRRAGAAVVRWDRAQLRRNRDALREHCTCSLGWPTAPSYVSARVVLGWFLACCRPLGDVVAGGIFLDAPSHAAPVRRGPALAPCGRGELLRGCALARAVDLRHAQSRQKGESGRTTPRRWQGACDPAQSIYGMLRQLSGGL
jgi:hypothetical protein